MIQIMSNDYDTTGKQDWYPAIKTQKLDYVIAYGYYMCPRNMNLK